MAQPITKKHAINMQQEHPSKIQRESPKPLTNSGSAEPLDMTQDTQGCPQTGSCSCKDRGKVFESLYAVSK